MPEVLIVCPILSLVDRADGGWPTLPAFSIDECAHVDHTNPVRKRGGTGLALAGARPAQQDCQEQERNSRPDRARVVARAKTVDCSNFRHDEASSFRRKHRRCLDSTFARRPARHQCRRLENYGSGQSLSGTLGRNDRSVNVSSIIKGEVKL